jgi:hypothetical protein
MHSAEWLAVHVSEQAVSSNDGGGDVGKEEAQEAEGEEAEQQSSPTFR